MLVQEKQFDQTDFSVTLLAEEYENCSFTNCNFSGIDLSGVIFTECIFNGCDLSMAKLIKTSLGDITFSNCKLLGLHFEDGNPFVFEPRFENCILDLSSFYRMKLKKIQFKNSSLHETDFTEADLTSAVFDNCDLKGAMFENTILEKADLRTAYNYSIDPELNKIKKARFSMPAVTRLLDKYDILID